MNRTIFPSSTRPMTARLLASPMKMLNRWTRRLRAERRDLLNAPLAVSLAAGAAGLSDGLVHAGGARLYAESPWVYVAVNRIAEAAALVPLQITDARTGERTADHPLLALLARPNAHMSRFELIEATIGMLELHGNAYWYLVGDARGLPCEIHPLPPERVRVVPEAAGVRGYLYEVDGVRVPLEPSEIVHFRRWNPTHDYYGLSALEAARLAVASDRAMARWNFTTFHEDRAVPAGIVAVKDFITDADFDRIKREWKQSYGGGERRTAFLRGASVEWQHIGLNHQDLDFLKGRAAHREEILSIFGIPLGLISENATEANATVAERQFIERTLWPKLVRIAAKITADLLPFWDTDAAACCAEFDDIRPTDAQARLEEIRTAYPLMSINELRQKYFALPPVAWGDAGVGSTVAPDKAAPEVESTPETAGAAISSPD